MLEGAFFGAAGAVLGLGFMRLFGYLIGAALAETQWGPIGALLVPDPAMVLAVAGLAFLVAVVAALVPAINLSGRPVVSRAREGE